MKTYQEFDINYFQDEDGMFTAEVPAIRGCVAWGKSLQDTYRNAVDAIESGLEARAKVAAMKLRKPRYAGAASATPMEVLMSLPAPEEIMRRAEESKAKAQAALAAHRQK